MNPHTHDFRHTVRPGEKTGDPFQSDRAFRSKRFPPGAAFMICFLLAPFAWAGIYFAASAFFQW
jgi:hypothetical protein